MATKRQAGTGVSVQNRLYIPQKDQFVRYTRCRLSRTSSKPTKRTGAPFTGAPVLLFSSFALVSSGRLRPGHRPVQFGLWIG
jgi:hypothetical protein